MSTNAKAKAAHTAKGNIKLTITFKSMDQMLRFKKLMQASTSKLEAGTGLSYDKAAQLNDESVSPAYWALDGLNGTDL